MAATGPGGGKKAAAGSSLHSKTLLKSEQLYQYILESTVFPREPDCLRELRVATTTHPMSGMAASPDQVQLFGLLIEMLGARNAIEVGVFTGYSLLATALALPDDGKVVAIDVSRESYDMVGSPVVEKAGMAHKIDFRVGLALPVLDQLVRPRMTAQASSTSRSWTPTRPTSTITTSGCCGWSGSGASSPTTTRCGAAQWPRQTTRRSRSGIRSSLGSPGSSTRCSLATAASRCAS